KLKSDEASNLAAYLESTADSAEIKEPPSNNTMIETGRKLVVEKGCLNCHALNGATTTFAARPLAELPAERWKSGCLAEDAADTNRAPRFAFTSDQRAALREFGAAGPASLRVDDPVAFLTRMSEHLHCRECHGKFDGVPAFESISDKLRPEWSARFI